MSCCRAQGGLLSLAVCFASGEGTGSLPAGAASGRSWQPAQGHFSMLDERDPFLARSLQNMQENMRRAGPAATASYTLIGAILLLGGIGFLVDRWQDTAPWFLLVGLVAGIVVGFYELAKTLWRPPPPRGER